MKAFKVVMKILVALAAVAGAVYVAATYGDQIVAWAKKLLGSAKCGCSTCDAEPEAAAEEAPAEEAPVEETPAEEAPAEEAPAEDVVSDADFEG